jgi:hypothetical protein
MQTLTAIDRGSPHYKPWAKRVKDAGAMKLRGHLRRAHHWINRISRRAPALLAHWQMGVGRGSMLGAG